MKAATDAGAVFMISPGLTPVLLEAACAQSVPLIPGISTISELMQGMEFGLDHFKFFPAEASGGIKSLKSIAGPFPDITFCPTGGINPDNATSYLALPNVACVGGSWLVTPEIIKEKNWKEITRLGREIIDRVNK
jgi:2-dehydro-3-deoxyphosphogluconate aldolase/(4S)-4-hydroxy-2-oxoglutarate aldolase